MSRLIIKNLPVYVTPARLREHFEQKGGPGGTLTDVKVSSKSDGTSRRFGFVGFKSEAEAQKAQKWFDRTFIDSTRINVSFSEGAADAPRPRKRQRLDPSTSHSDSTTPSSVTKDQKSPMKSDKNREEFMKLMEKKKGPAWANEAATPVPIMPAEPTPSVVPAPEDTEAQGAISDVEWMRQRMSAAVVDEVVEERVFEQDEEDGGKPVNATESQKQGTQPATADASKPVDPTKETILQTARLFVRNLAFSCTDEELRELFEPFGQISQIHTPRDPTTKQHKGLAYVTFAKPTDALAAYEALDKRSFQGRLLHILAAVDRKGKPEVQEGEGHKKSLKEEKNQKRKAMAGQEFNWSMLYMNSDAVASSIAARMNIDKSEILNPESGDNAAVKLALAETHIIQETKSYLESQGVLLSAFSSKARSDTTILVKNIPYGTSEEQIREMFEPHGELARVLIPPAGTMAVVDFEKPDEAAKAFRAVAYRRLGNSVVYLEKGPLGMFIEGFVPPTKGTASAPTTTAAHAVRIPEQVGAADDTDDVEEPSIAGGSTLYVKNLAFSTTQERLAKVFSHLPSFSFARVQTKPDPKRPDGRLSMGYGFLGFKDPESAKKALKSVQGFVLDGHALYVSFAGRGAEEAEAEKKGKVDAGKSRTTKMIVKNVPFEATKKDMRDLFGAHGHLKSVRLPKKFDSRSRGFAFLEFVSRHEAENAYNTLRHTHFLGRHLVLEWAEEAEQDIEVLRKKASVGYGGGKAMPGQKRKLDMGRNDEEDVEALE
ncbi:Multiple RNA-binding domain-containing protein 1 [Psilocybe cubensis]|uniref:Multiple RNA-binding domain-containing protein 1 n=1 Tax=Psilocybe cubensis TaxID=181762 RepID=A0ACB8GMQ1_PSICU|nr:Multiple RNA-binding domain-containing protein 1 [Psilocybe cubensis]KAH9476672.1 Multiple RNA-binding domain-containing protein 1 [Psilocybe cubensis]